VITSLGSACASCAQPSRAQRQPEPARPPTDERRTAQTPRPDSNQIAGAAAASAAAARSSAAEAEREQAAAAARETEWPRRAGKVMHKERDGERASRESTPRSELLGAGEGLALPALLARAGRTLRMPNHFITN
jgi:hypothetical protein